MSPAIRCGPYELVARGQDSLIEAEDGTIQVYAEDAYLVRLAADADPGVLGRTLSVPRGGSEGQLRFRNFVGRTELGGRPLDVRSKRLDSTGVERMLDEVSGWFTSLPFAPGGPVGAGYRPRHSSAPRVLYHAFALLRDAFRRVGIRDLRADLERLLAQPHESLSPDEPRLVPLGAASRVDAETVDAILGAPEVLRQVDRSSSPATTSVVRQMRGMLPETVRVRPFRHTTDNPENRFIAGAIDAMIDLLRQFERLARAQRNPARATNASEAAAIVDLLGRCRAHHLFDGLRPTTEVPAQSAVLRSRPGYRDLFALHNDLQARMHATQPHDAEPLLESRDAATIYEFWCYVRVVRSLEGILGPPLEQDRFRTDGLQAKLPWRYGVRWAGVDVSYNATFSPPGVAGDGSELRSYSLRMRPDIVLRCADGRLYVFDAKLKNRPLREATRSTAGRGDGGAAANGFKPEDLHKMHAYRDALSVESAWVLYPGTATAAETFPAPADAEEDRAGFRGVGAIPLRPGGRGDGGLGDILKAMVAG